MFKKLKRSAAGIMVFATHSLYAGFYAGVGLGPDTVDFNQRANVFGPPSPGHPQNFNVINKTHLSGTGIFGTLFVGFERLYNQYYIAGEINGNISSVTHTEFNHEYIHANFADTFIKINNSVGISAIPGYQFNPNTLFYGRLGWTNSELKQRTGDVSLANFSTRLNGFRYGVGIKQAITDQFAVRMDYSRIAYPHFDTGTVDLSSQVTKNTRLSTNQQLLEFGVVYNFDRAVKLSK